MQCSGLSQLTIQSVFCRKQHASRAKQWKDSIPNIEAEAKHTLQEPHTQVMGIRCHRLAFFLAAVGNKRNLEGTFVVLVLQTGATFHSVRVYNTNTTTTSSEFHLLLWLWNILFPIKAGTLYSFFFFFLFGSRTPRKDWKQRTSCVALPLRIDVTFDRQFPFCSICEVHCFQGRRKAESPYFRAQNTGRTRGDQSQSLLQPYLVTNC